MNKIQLCGNTLRMTLIKFKRAYNNYWSNTLGYRILTSTPYMLFLTAMAALFFNLNLAIASLFFFACIIAVSMLISKDLSPCLLPLLLAAMSVLKMYGSKFEDYLILAAPVIILAILLVFRPLYAPTKINFGYMFTALFFVGVALAVGGIGSIDYEQYFGYVPIFYVLGLGFGMALAYIMMRSYTFSGGVYRPSCAITKTMLCVGLMGILMVAPVVVGAIANNKAWEIQWSNNLSTIMIFAIPFSFYKAVISKRFGAIWFTFGALETLVTMLTLSRGGILFVLVTFVLAVIFAIIFSKNKKSLILTLFIILIVGCAILLTDGTIDKLMDLIKISADEPRVNLIQTAIDNFKNSPIFGAGMAFVGEFYYPQDWALYWYHSLPFQIIGAMGLVGVIAYGYIFYKRIRLCFIVPTKFSMACLIAIAGFTLMGCVNPGEFAPVPYAIMICAITVYIELSNINLDHNDLIVVHLNGKRTINYSGISIDKKTYM